MAIRDLHCTFQRANDNVVAAASYAVASVSIRPDGEVGDVRAQLSAGVDHCFAVKHFYVGAAHADIRSRRDLNG